MGGEAMEREISIRPENENSKEDAEGRESEKQVEEGGGGMPIPLYRWLMHGAVMFGREFCYAMETALVTPVLLQIGLPKQYYSLTWFLSPVLGFIFTPIIGSASDRCTLRWGRRRPFILALCVGVLLGVALFLNGSLIGRSIGDEPNNQTISIVLTVLGVVVLDFCADAAEGPIRAYLLDVADTEEQDMALNIHAFSAGLGGAVGYMLGGLDWTGTALGKAFKAQEQVLFLFAGIFFIISVALHMFSIPEQPLTRTSPLKDTVRRESSSQLSIKPVGPSLNVITEEDPSAQAPSGQDKIPGFVEENMDFLAVERVRSKSDSVLALPDATIEFDPDLDPERQIFLPETHFQPELNGDIDNAFKPSENSNDSPPSDVNEKLTKEHEKTNHQVLSEPRFITNGRTLIQRNCESEDSRLKKVNTTKDVRTGLASSHLSHAVKSHNSSQLGSRNTNDAVTKRPRAHSFYRQPSFTFSYHGRVGSQKYRLRRPGHLSPRRITASRSLNDLSSIQWPKDRRTWQLSTGSLSSEGSSSEEGAETGATVKLLWLSMFKMPSQLWRLCICHLLTWFSYIAEAVFYTDFMGQVIFNGDPTAPSNSTELLNYHKGVQMGCWGLVVFAATAALCSVLLLKCLDNFDLSIKVIYTVGTLGFSIGTALMAIFPNVYVAMVTISSMGLISISISYCPYALLGQYHEIKEFINHSPANTRRGFGIDCAILSCQVYVSQILVASALGSVVEAVGSVHVIPVVASVGSFLGFLTACFLVIYPDVEPSDSEQDQGLVGVFGQEEQSEERSLDKRLLELAGTLSEN